MVFLIFVEYYGAVEDGFTPTVPAMYAGMVTGTFLYVEAVFF